MRTVIFTGLVNIDKNLVGTAVIYKKIADLMLRLGYAVDLVVPELSGQSGGAKYHCWDQKNNQKLIDQSDLAVFGAYPPIEPMLYASRMKKTIMTYLWSIAPIGSLEFRDFSSASKQHRLHEYINASYNLSLLLSNKIFCRDNEARKLVLGSLLSLGRIDLENYQKDRSLKHLIEVAPFGLEGKSPRRKKNVYRGVMAGIRADDFLLLWNGGVWNWNDGRTLIETMRLIRDKYRVKNIKLVFQGFSHPDKRQKLSAEAVKTLALAKRHGLIGQNVFFADWAPFADRGGYLTECDAGIVTSPDIPEANFFLKTRIYDYLWAALPVVLGDNEAFASFIGANGLGVVAKCGQAEDWAKKIIALSRDKKMQAGIKDRIRKANKDLTWNKALQPVKDFLKSPKKDQPILETDQRLLFKNIKHNIEIIRRGL